MTKLPGPMLEEQDDDGFCSKETLEIDFITSLAQLYLPIIKS